MIDEAKLWEAYRISLKLSGIEYKEGKWVRFYKGFKALRQASLERDVAERTHHWVRALEALLKTEQRRSRGQFVERCQLFTGESPASASFFLDVYNTRSFVEHMNGLESLQKPGEGWSDTADRVDSQSGELELVALEVYRRILGSSTLLEAFQTDTSTELFWAMDSADREAAWGEAIDVTAVKSLRQREMEARNC